MLAQAIIAYNEKGPKEALFYMKKVVEVSGANTPPDIWVSIGILHFKLKNLPKAKFALEHVLNLQPDNPMAITCLAIVEMQINFGEGSQRLKAVELFHRSFELDDTNPLTMKHLAEHFFFTGELDMAEALCKRAIKFCERLEKPKTADLITWRKDIYILCSDLNYTLGKIAHSREDFDAALSFYF